MTKQQEIRLFDRMIKAYGPNSYIGPWLVFMREDIVRCIKSDLSIDTIETLVK